MSHLSNLTIATKRVQFLSPIFAKLMTLTLFAGSLTARTRWDNTSTDRDRALSLGQSPVWQGSDWLGAQNQQSRRWLLGVTGQNRDTGVLVTAVANNSAASRTH